jgi:hypothetical protein
MKAANNPAMIVDGYRIDNGTNVGNGPTWVFEAPYGAAAIVAEGNQAWLDAIWARVSAGDPGVDVNAETIRLLSMLVMSGHWWPAVDVAGRAQLFAAGPAAARLIDLHGAPLS